MVSKCIVGLFWGRHFQHGGKFLPKTVPQRTLTIILTRSPVQHQSGEYGMHTNETFRTNEERHTTLPNERTTFRLLFFIKRWYLLGVRDY